MVCPLSPKKLARYVEISLYPALLSRFFRAGVHHIENCCCNLR